MSLKNEKIRACLVGAIIVVSVVIFVTTFVQASLYSPGDTGVSAAFIPTQAFASSSTASSSTSAPSAVLGTQSADPSRLIIPALGINAHVQYVGVNTKNNIGTPNNFTDVAWYSFGVAPGQAGTAVIDGHVDNGLGLAGVFKHLSDIQIGDDVNVVTKDGTTLHFIVTKIQAYPYQDVSEQALFGSSTTSSFLNLITCDGTWVQGGDTYNERLIVTAALEP